MVKRTVRLSEESAAEIRSEPWRLQVMEPMGVRMRLTDRVLEIEGTDEALVRATADETERVDRERPGTSK